VTVDRAPEKFELARPQVTRVEILLFIENEVVRRGLEAMISQIETATVLPDGLTEVLSMELTGSTERFILTTFPEWPRLHEQLSTAHPRPFVLLVGDDVRSKDLSQNSDLPCDGVISLAGASVENLEETLFKVVAGEIPMPTQLTRELLAINRGRQYRSSGQSVALTAREKETLSLLVQGLSNKQIAKSLNITTHGVKRLVGTVLLKLDAPNRTAAVVTALNEGLV
jgi:two-component system nitrate/nitrite response regulator NarL